MISDMIKKKEPEIEKIKDVPPEKPKKTDDKLAEYIGASSKKKSIRGFFSNFFSGSSKKNKK